MKKWEYKIISIKAIKSFLGGKFDYDEINTILNKEGEDGWELVNIVSTNHAYGDTNTLGLVFKRLKDESF